MRSLVLGFDAFDPSVFERLCEQGQTPNLAKYVVNDAYARFQVANPPQSEVSWTSIATGLNPGSHGIFDFVHRHPKSYSLFVSLLPTKRGMGGNQFVRPSNATTIFDQAAKMGFPATSLWWPATFPARPESPVRTLPGLGTPDIKGRLGIGTLFTSEEGVPSPLGKTPVNIFSFRGKDRYNQELWGPVRKTQRGENRSSIPIYLDVTNDDSAILTIGKQKKVRLEKGVWSPILEVQFKVGLFISLRVLTQVIMTQVRPTVRLYFLPLQQHPVKSPWRYGTPGSFVKRTWKESGPYLTLGWPQDTVGLEDGCISDEQFLELCNSIFYSRIRIFLKQLENFQEGLLGVVFDSLDRIQHMFWRDRPDIIEEWYIRLDNLVGKVQERLALNTEEKPRIVIVSDHGFADFDFKVHLNRWLIENGYLVTKEGVSTGDWDAVDWARTRAYSIGLNGIYLNLVGREGQGQVQPHEGELLIDKLRSSLLGWNGPDGNSVVRQVWRNEDLFSGPLSRFGPDLVIGYSPGYRASSKTGLGGWANVAVEKNTDHWAADHCIDPNSVPGVLFTNLEPDGLRNCSYHDIPLIAIGEEPDQSAFSPPDTISEEENAIIQERLKGLGYF
jgi:predicted AlkP superfamily phosphohydrolase/phosphomutase